MTRTVLPWRKTRAEEFQIGLETLLDRLEMTVSQ